MNISALKKCRHKEYNADIGITGHRSTYMSRISRVLKETSVLIKARIMDAFIKKGFYTIGALKTNRVLYPCGIKQKVGEFALHIRKTDAAVSLVTVGSRSYYIYRYEGNLNGIENAVVLISYPKDAFHVPKALRAFISTDVSLSTREILDIYVERWPVEMFFRQAKDRLAFDRYQVRSSQVQ